MSCKRDCVNTIVKAIDAKFGRDIQVLDISELTTLTEHFVIATGGSPSNIQAICDHVEDEMAKLGIRHLNKEGYDNAEWVLLGYDDVIVHIFKGELRDFYNLEHIWKDAKTVDISDLIVKE